MSRPRRHRQPAVPAIPEILLSEDGTQKAALMLHQGIVIADYYRHAGAMNGISRSWWKWDRRAEVRIQPLEAALGTIQRIVNTPFPKRR